MTPRIRLGSVTDIELERSLEELVNRFGEQAVVRAVNQKSKKNKSRELTIVVNFGMHALPEEILCGDVFFFSEGNLDLSPKNVKDTILNLSSRALKFLRGKIWGKVYLVPSGHPLLVSVATLVAYRVTRINPTIVYYMDGRYNDAEFDIRMDLVKDNRLT